MLRREDVGRVFGHLAALCTAAVLIVLITVLYVEAEDGYYFWDYAVYQALAVKTLWAFEKSFSSGLAFLRESTIGDYNAFFAVPLLPLLHVLGDSRMAYEMALNLTYLLPFALVLGAIATTVLKAAPARVFWSTVALTLLTPMVWIPTLRGYPDIGAAVLVVLAVWACLIDPDLARPRTIVAVGGLLMLAVVYRRHYLFAASALLATVAVHGAARLLATPGLTRRLRAMALLRIALRLALTLAVGLLSAFVLGRPVAMRLVSHNFYNLYTAYLNSPRVVAAWFVEPYGWLGLGGAVCGFWVALRYDVVDRSRALFLAAFGAIGAVQWLLLVRQVGEQYTYHFTPIVIVGLIAFGFTVALRAAPPWRTFAPYFLAIYAAEIAFFGISPIRLVRLRPPLRSLLPSTWSPLMRDDQETFTALLALLRRLTQPSDRIFVAASSVVLNPDLLANSERSIYGWPNARLDIIDTPAIDSRDQYPLDALLQARVVVTVDPLQVHLPPEEQEVVKVIHDLFDEGGALTQDFVKIPTALLWLQGGAHANIYKRVRQSSVQTGILTLRYMQEHIHGVPGSQADWAMVSERFPSWISRRVDGDTTVIWHPSLPHDPPPSVALYLPPPPSRARVRGAVHFIDRECQGARLTFAALAADGTMTDLTALERRPEEAEDFEVSFAIPPGRSLAMRLAPRDGQASIDYCMLKVDALRVRDAP